MKYAISPVTLIVIPGLTRNPGFPVKTGTQFICIVSCFRRDGVWIPAFAGMTVFVARIYVALFITHYTSFRSSTN